MKQQSSLSVFPPHLIILRCSLSLQWSLKLLIPTWRGDLDYQMEAVQCQTYRGCGPPDKDAAPVTLLLHNYSIFRHLHPWQLQFCDKFTNTSPLSPGKIRRSSFQETLRTAQRSKPRNSTQHRYTHTWVLPRQHSTHGATSKNFLLRVNCWFGATRDRCMGPEENESGHYHCQGLRLSARPQTPPLPLHCNCGT